MMKAIIATCFESNEERVSFVLDVFKKRKIKTKVITTNFSHIKKSYRKNIPNGFDTIDTLSYEHNLSIKRIKSHRKFSKDLFIQIEKENPDIIWLMVPANSLIEEAKKYKENHPTTKLIIDVIDMWPESLPININHNIFPLNIWENIRKDNISCADVLVTECDYYQKVLKEEYNKDIYTLHWAKEKHNTQHKIKTPNDKLSLCYIGSINNIIDAEIVNNIIKKCKMPVVLHVIGEGENRYHFVDLNKRNCEVIYHGAIRDANKKAEIFSLCHAGLNIYKNDLYIGLTVKSIDYFENGLPIINNIKGDTYKLIEENKIGININDKTTINEQELINMRKNNKKIIQIFNNNFSREIFTKNCNAIIDKVLE